MVDPTDDNIPPEWKARIEEAQAMTHDVIAGKRYPRVPYGTEVANPKPRCRDCAVKIGQLHVDGCCVELCPMCRHPLLSAHCDCDTAADHGFQ